MKTHWDLVYSRLSPERVSWFEESPVRALEAIAAAGLSSSSPIIDVGAGASLLVDELLRRGFRDVTVLDISAVALQAVERRLGEAARHVQLMRADVADFRPARPFAFWHDRAVFHFLTGEREREAYRQALSAGTRSGSHVLMSTFGPGGPPRCSGLDTSRYDASTLTAEMGSDFRLVDWKLEDHVTPDNSRQQFLHAHFMRV